MLIVDLCIFIHAVRGIDSHMSCNYILFFLLFRWAYPLLGLPFILLLNDALHFIPEDGPLSYLLRF